VISQSPDGGAKGKPKSTVTIVVGHFVETTTPTTPTTTPTTPR
jgi:beta-lactam-binding protein with PASTA domain